MFQAKLKILQKKKGGEGGEEMVKVKAEVTMIILNLDLDYLCRYLDDIMMTLMSILLWQ